MGVFDPPAPVRPVRIRIDSDSPGADIDVQAFAYLLIYPNPDTATPDRLAFSFRVLTDDQLAAFVTSAIQIGISRGVMQRVFANLIATPGNIDVKHFPPLPPGTPKDDLPPHAR